MTITSSVTLTANVAQQITGKNQNRLELCIQNTGLGNVTLGFGSAPAGIGLGLCLDAASTAGGQGGSRVWMLNTLAPKTRDDWVPEDSIWALSAVTGATVIVVEQ